MTDPTITCPNCKTEIKLTESLAAPLIESTRKQYEKQITDKDAEVTKREAASRTTYYRWLRGAALHRAGRQ